MRFYNSIKLAAVVVILSTATKAMAIELREQFQVFQDSILGAKFEFKCGKSILKLEKKMLDLPKIYIKEHLEWVELDDLKVHSTGITFNGLGLTGDLPKSALYVESNLPIFNKQNNRYRDTADFYSIVSEEKFKPFVSQVDFYTNKLIQLNSAKYRGLSLII
ncbi:hypothetical protein [Photobacterium kagoshimensis]|uniref:hypothetical protein n=1 Tax=Photobacterium kagoshimensis TaxID=2910242 RepID=UPI003D10C8CF